MAKHARRPHDLAANAAACSVAFALPLAMYIRTLAPTLTWQHHGADGGDLAAAVATLGIPHPTGYPTYVLLGRLFLLVPWGDLAHRLNLMSVCFGALSVLLLCVTILRTLRWSGEGNAAAAWTLPAAMGSALSFAFSRVFWSQALITEVYTLNAFFVALIILLLVEWLTRHQRAPLLVAAFVCGVALGNHATIALLVATVPLLVLPCRRVPCSIGTLFLGAGGLLLGLCVYLYLPLRAAYHPPVNWGAPYTWHGFRWTVSGALYRRFVFALPLSYLPDRLLAWLRLFVDQFGWWGALVSLVGWWSLWQARQRLGLYLSAVFLVYSAYAVGYNTTDSHVYLIPAFLVCTVWLGWGAAYLVDELRAALGLADSGLVATLAFCLPLALPIPSLVGNLPALDLSRDYAARDYGLDVLSVLPPEAIVVSQADPYTFTLWYLLYAEGRRPDVTVVDGDLLVHSWYRAELDRQDPSLVAETAELSSLPPAAAFVASHLERRPLYLAGPSSDLRDRYLLSREGSVYQVVGAR